ncbi:MAG: glycosyltransferase family 2 protein [Candidatus Caenarcaniphilales bacterium]|nr:glycosyltransferase family 2 protein [Candidatus Caenarcaniphilales bacterium]
MKITETKELRNEEIKQPFFSIVICNYNYGQFIGQTIESCLKQNYPEENFEIIVVDDGSTDNSREVIQRYSEENNIKFFFQDNQGQAAAFNTGVSNAKGKFICLLDSDDLFLANKLNLVNKRISKYKSVPKYFFLCNDLFIMDNASEKYLNKTWFQSINLSMLSLEMLVPGQYNFQYPFAFPAGQVYSKALLEDILKKIKHCDWKQGADSPIAHGALLLADAVHYEYEALGVYRIHGNNHFMGIDGQNNPKAKINYSSRTPKLINFLSELLESDLMQENGANIKRYEYIETLKELLESELASGAKK